MVRRFAFLGMLLLATDAAAWTADGVTLVAQPELSSLTMAGDGSGGGVVVYTSGDTGRATLGIQRFASDGSRFPGWPASGVGLDPYYGAWANVISDGAGGAFVAWRRSPPDRGMIAVQHVLADGSFAPGWPDTGAVAVDGSIGPSVLPLALDGAGGVFVAWQDFRISYGRQVVYVQHLDASGHPVANWTSSGLPCSDGEGGQFDPVLVPDGAGGVIVTWWDGRNFATSGYDIRAQRMNGDGFRPPGWSPGGGVIVCDAPANQEAPGICTDGAGGALITWADARAGQTETAVFAQHLLANGTVADGWAPDGLPIGEDAHLYLSPSIVTDGNGGAFVAWIGPRTSQQDVTQMTHAPAAGLSAIGGLPAPRVLSTDPRVWYPSLREDGAGGVVAVVIHGDDFGDISRFDPEGNPHPQWPSSIRIEWPFSTLAVPMVSDGSGGVILGWLQYSGSSDSRIRLQRITGAGVVAPGWNGYPSHGWLADTAPNPTADAATVRFALPAVSPTTLVVFDLHGRRVRGLLDGTPLPAGQHALSWDGRDDDGHAVRAGVYFLKLDAASVRETKRIVVAR